MGHGAAVVGLTVVLAHGNLQLPSPGPVRPAPGTTGLVAPAAPLVEPSRPRDPFAGLFAPGPSETPPAGQAPRATPPDDSPPANAPPALRVVCGMTVVTVDPAVDPRMPRMTPPADRAYAIRAMPPPICRD